MRADLTRIMAAANVPSRNRHRPTGNYERDAWLDIASCCIKTAGQRRLFPMTGSELNFNIEDAAAKRRLIAEIAYFSAERRGFSPGYELDDWLQAEQEVEASLEALEP
jgi:Protein of unknown function (DUF2934)